MATRSLLRCADNKDKFLAITFHTIRAHGMLACMWDAIKQDDTDDTMLRRSEDVVVAETELETGADEEHEVERELRAQKEDERVLRAQIRILKICVTAWRFQHMDSIALTYEEFEHGMKRLDFVPPIVVSKSDWNARVVRYNKLSCPSNIFSSYKNSEYHLV
jgi:hypothetical protein